jgi:hypothetical protein
MSRARETLEVYSPNTPYSDPPDALIPYDQGKICVERGDADFVNRGKAIRLRRGAPLRAGSLECNKSKIELFDFCGRGMSRGAQESTPCRTAESVA